MADAVHLVLFLLFWIAVIVAAYRKPWWLPVPVGAVAAVLLGIANLAAQGGVGNPAGVLIAALGGALAGLIVIGIRAVLRKVRRDPFA